MNFLQYKKKVLASLCVSSVLFLSGCGDSKSIDDYVKSAQNSIVKNEFQEAIIALKNAVRIEPQNAKVRAQLGRVYIQHGNASGAEKELRRALDLGGDSNDIIPLLLEAIMFSGQYDEAIEFINNINIDLSPAASDSVTLYRAIGLSYLSQINEHGYVIEKLKSSPNTSYQKVGELFKTLNDEDPLAFSSAVSQLPDVGLEKEIWFFLGKVYLSNQNFSAATAMFNKYQGTREIDLRIKLYQAQSLLGESKFNESEILVDRILEVVEKQPLANQTKGIISYRNGKYKDALLYAEQSINNGLDLKINRLVAGISAYKLERFELSYHYLTSVIDEIPGEHPVRNILIMVQNELGYFSEAAELLKKSNLDDKSFNLLALMSQKLLQTGKTAEAKELIEKSKDITLTTAESNFERGVFRLSLNDLEGILDLEKSLELSPELSKAKKALITAYLTQGKNNKAIDLAKELIEQSPDGHMGYLLLARSYLANENIIASEQALRKGYSVNPENNTTILFLANLLMAKSEWKEALAILYKQLTVKPVNTKILTTYYQASKSAGEVETDNAIQSIKNAARNNASRQDLSLLYGSVLYAEGKFKAAIKELEILNGSELKSEIYWLALGDSYINIGDYEQAKNTLEESLQYQPRNKISLMKLAEVYEKLSSFDLALNLVRKGLIYYPADEKLLSLSIYYSIRIHDYIGANTIIDALPDNMQSTALIKALKGQVLYGMKKYKESIDYLKIQYDIEPNTRHIAMLATAYYKSDLGNRAITTLKKYLDNNAKDVFARGLLAEYAMVHNISLAQEQYEILLQKYPNNVLILNNLAWIEYKLKNYAKAKFHIDKALFKKPDNSKINDTLGMIYLATGKVELAISTFKKALLLAPGDSDILNHLAEAQNTVK